VLWYSHVGAAAPGKRCGERFDSRHGVAMAMLSRSWLAIAQVALMSRQAGVAAAGLRSLAGNFEQHVLGGASSHSAAAGAHDAAGVNKTASGHHFGLHLWRAEGDFLGAPMSPSMQCILVSTVQVFVIYLLLQFCQTVNQISPGSAKGLEGALQSSRKSVDILPMLCCLYVGTRMRAGEINPTGSPPVWAQTFMYIATCSAATATVLDILGSTSQFIARMTSLLQFFVLLTIYVSILALICSNFLMTAGGGSLVCPDCPSYTPGLAPALKATILMTLLFFTFNGMLSVTANYNRLKWKGIKGPIQISLETTQDTMKFCPMLAILFLGARMRALQLQATARGPGNRAANVNPQPWAQDAFYTCIFAVFGQLLAKVVVDSPTAKFEAGAESRAERRRASGGFEDMNEGKFQASGGAFAAKFLEIVCMVFMFAGLITIVTSVYLIEIPAFLEMKTPPVSPAMHCAMNLTLLYFAIHMMVTLVRMYRDLIAKGQEINMEHVLNGALPTLAIIPVLCILFIAARVRCLELDPVNGSPEKWTQDLMYVCVTFSVVNTFLAMACVLVSHNLRDPDLPTPRDDNYDADNHLASKQPKATGNVGAIVWIMNALTYISVIVVYSSAIGIIVAVMVKT